MEASIEGLSLEDRRSDSKASSDEPAIKSDPKSQKKGVSYVAERVIGNGSFGVVFLARSLQSGERVAIKKVLQDRRYKNRELQVMKYMSHPNLIEMKHYFYSAGSKPNEVYLNLVLEFMPQTLYRFYRTFVKLKQPIPMFHVKIFAYHMCRGLNYMHKLNICHRDVKPQNVLVDMKTGMAKFCDFGSAKRLVAGEPNVSYICSRFYRAPELIFGSREYTCAIDTWSLGCVIAETLLGRPLFPGSSSVEQLVEIVKVLGTPTKAQIERMCKDYTGFKFPQIVRSPWRRIFRSPSIPDSAIDLIDHMLVYDPELRLSPLELLSLPFFDELRDPSCTLPSGEPLPELFNFSEVELQGDEDKPFVAKLIPPHKRAK